MSKFNRKFILTTLFAIIGTLIGALSVTLTWFARINSMDLDIGGSVLSTYFDSGDGTEEDPFVITRPKHWENLVWLHNNVSDFYQAIADNQDSSENNKGYYFQVGKINEDNEGDETLYVYDYLDNGMINPENNKLTSRTLNLNGLGSLIPIGSASKPFIGELTSDGITVSGFDVLGFEDKNSDMVHDEGEKGFNDVGIFGYIGANSSVSNIYFDDFRIHLAYSDAEFENGTRNLHNDSFHDLDGSEGLDTIYAGYIAGHLHHTAAVTDVYINHCTLDGGSAATTGFGYFGIIEKDDETRMPTPADEINATKQQGEGNNFGGSVDMLGVYDRLARIYASTPDSSQTRYVNNETIIKNDVTRTKETYSQTTASVVAWGVSSGGDYLGYRYASTTDGGVFNFPADNDGYNVSGSDNIYQCLYGESKHYTKTVTTYTFIDDWYSCFFIQNGENYLNHRYYTDIQAVEDESIAAGWNFDSSNHLYTKVFDVTYYLNRDNFTLELGTSASTTWTKNNDDEIYTVINGVNYYLNYEDDWCLSPYRERYTISENNGNYLSLNDVNSIKNSTSETAATKWFLSNPSGNTTIACNYQNDIRYLNGDTENLCLSSAPTTWYKEGNYFYTTIASIKHYLVFENNAWMLKPEDGVYITDGSNHYLSDNGNVPPAVANSNSQNNAVIWHFSSATGDTQIYYSRGGTKTYLSFSNGLLVSSSVATTWHRNGNQIYYTSGNRDYYLTYDNGWKVTSLEYYLIHDNNSTNYLVVNGTNSFSNTTNRSNATHFYYSNTSGTNPSGTINCFADNKLLYLNLNIANNNGELQTATSSGTSWSNNGNSIYYVSGSFTYYLEYENGWHIRTYAEGRYISNGSIYLTVNGNTIGYSETKDNATIFTFETVSSGTYRIKPIGSNNYLYDTNSNSGTSLGLSTTTGNSRNFTEDTNGVKSYYNKYFVFDDVQWMLSTGTTMNAYTIRNNNNSIYSYLGTDGTKLTNDETVWRMSNKGGSGTVYTVINHQRYYIVQSGNVPSISTTSTYNWYNGSTSRLRAGTYGYYLYNNGTSWTMSNSSKNLSFSTVALTFTRAKSTTIVNNIINTKTTKRTITAPTVQTVNYVPTLNTRLSSPISKSYVNTFTNTELQKCEKTIANNVRSGNPTYFPLRVDKDDTTGAYPAGYAASDKNTGYIVSGSHLDEATYPSNQAYQPTYGDIRVAGWDIKNIAASYTNGAFTNNIYTVDGSSNEVRTLTATEKADPTYTNALANFGETLRGQSRVYGLHFMDAQISKNNLITADKVTILGNTYFNYQLPEDSIDFNVYQRGKISFFAGNYFTNNNSFFSLHKIFRDEYNDITDIKEIIEVYKHSEKLDKANYIYKFSDGTYTNPNGTYTGATSLDSKYNSTAVFKTTWITNPTGINSNRTRLFYFSIPCNAGEYALGSVPGKNGAYLCYLDIATNGGDNMLDFMKNTETATTFKSDVRSATDTTPHSLLQIGAEMPEEADPSKLSISISFDNSSATCDGTPYSNGLYTITVVNKTGYDIELSVLVIDDNDDLTDEYLYGYKVIYTNGSKTKAVIETLDDSGNNTVEYWQRLAIFVIPNTGEAAESDYST